MRNLVIIFSLLVALSVCIYAGSKIFKKCKNVVSGYKASLNSSQLLLAEQSRAFEVSRPLKVVCLGNSITRHSYRPEVEWYSDWGMAASKPEHDFVHVLQARLREYNQASSVTPLNIASWERNPEGDLDSLLGNACDSADVIVIRLGENVQDVRAFQRNLQRLIDKCRSHTPHIILTGMFWINGEKEEVLLNAALDNQLRFVPLSWIGEIRDAYPHKGDTIYNREGQPYVLTKEFILSHPNDEGMRLIANSIFNAITRIDL